MTPREFFILIFEKLNITSDIYYWIDPITVVIDAEFYGIIYTNYDINIKKKTNENVQFSNANQVISSRLSKSNISDYES